MPASVLGEGQDGIIRPVQEHSSPHAAGHPPRGQPPLAQRVLTWSDWAEVPHKPLPLISRPAFRKDHLLATMWGSECRGSLTSEHLRGTLSSLQGRLLSWLHPDEKALRPPEASRSAAPGGLPLSGGKGEDNSYCKPTCVLWLCCSPRTPEPFTKVGEELSHKLPLSWSGDRLPARCPASGECFL